MRPQRLRNTLVTRSDMSATRQTRSHTFSLSFTLAMAGVVFCVAGLSGYDLMTRAMLLAEERWVDGVIWWEVYFGAGFALGAMYFGRTADRIARQGADR